MAYYFENEGPARRNVKNGTLVNRTEGNLIGLWDGRRFTLPPGEIHGFTYAMCLKFRDQHPIMGTENPYTGEKQYLLGVVEEGDPIDPINQTKSPTLVNIDQALKDGDVKIVKGQGIYSPNRDGASGLSQTDPGNIGFDGTRA